MPQIGEIQKGTNIGFKVESKYIWHACELCGKERWVNLHKGMPTSKICDNCNHKRRGINSSNWKGGRYNTAEGYIERMLQPDDFFYSMARKSGYILEHRLVMAKSLGRCLLKIEKVHHINGIRDDNRVSNLELISPVNHTLYKQMCYNCILRKEIRLLRWQIKELSEQLQGRLVP
jgi:hypothetical protein